MGFFDSIGNVFGGGGGKKSGGIGGLLGGGGGIGGLLGGGGSGQSSTQGASMATGGGGFGIGIDVLGLDAAEFYETYSKNERFTDAKKIKNRELSIREREQAGRELEAAARLVAGENIPTVERPTTQSVSVPNGFSLDDNTIVIAVVVAGVAILLLAE